MEPSHVITEAAPDPGLVAETRALALDSVGRNCLSYWFPKLSAADVPVPRTEIIDAGADWFQMIGIAEGPRHRESFEAATALIAHVSDAIRAAAEKVGGYPLFLRTGHFSGKHDWSRTCHVPDAASVPEHVAHLVYMSEMFAMAGELPYRMWCVRELLPVDPVAVLPEYGNMPLVKEVRAFVQGGRVVCAHPYWPPGAIERGFGGSPGMPQALEGIALRSADEQEWRPLSERVAAEFTGDGAWSVDLLATRWGWYVTDMAEAARSFHWDGCKHANELR